MAPLREGDRAHRADRRLRGDLALPDLPAAQADQLGPDRRLPRGRAVGAGERAWPATCGAASRSRSSTSACSPIPIALIAADRAAADHRGQRLRRTRCPSYARDVTQVRQGEQSACASSTTTTTSPSKLEKEAGKLPEPARRRRRHAARRRLRHRQLAVRADHDPRADGVPARQRADVGRRRRRAATTRAARPAATRARQHGRGRGRLRGGRAADRADRRRRHLHRADDPRRAVPRPAGADRRAVLADPAGRRHDRRRADRARHGVRRLPDHHDHLGDLGDRLPAVREPRDPAAGAEAHGQRAPFITIVAVLFGATLLGVLGALVAIPIAASIQILLREYVDLRTMSIKATRRHRRRSRRPSPRHRPRHRPRRRTRRRRRRALSLCPA